MLVFANFCDYMVFCLLACPVDATPRREAVSLGSGESSTGVVFVFLRFGNEGC